MKRRYRTAEVFPPLREMLKELNCNESVDKEALMDILTAVADGVSFQDAVQDFWEAIDGYMYEELVEDDDFADEAYDRFKDERGENK